MTWLSSMKRVKRRRLTCSPAQLMPTKQKPNPTPHKTSCQGNFQRNPKDFGLCPTLSIDPQVKRKSAASWADTTLTILICLRLSMGMAIMLAPCSQSTHMVTKIGTTAMLSNTMTKTSHSEPWEFNSGSNSPTPLIHIIPHGRSIHLHSYSYRRTWKFQGVETPRHPGISPWNIGIYLEIVIRCFLSYLNIMGVTLPEPSSGNAHKAGILFELLEIPCAAIAHTCPKAAN